ncbi:hypothetical protein DPMN_186033 [Dreissena polymorpha]|uniref:Uncharacterized protein n=1 Tax=Dreissena polymorpha TaxID=45954 RepID=A0A9D4DPR6_DREPO|nr:hypothetical protein DPMN_186033 [Dreissena polymorpha]
MWVQSSLRSTPTIAGPTTTTIPGVSSGWLKNSLRSTPTIAGPTTTTTPGFSSGWLKVSPTMASDRGRANS